MSLIDIWNFIINVNLLYVFGYAIAGIIGLYILFVVIIGIGFILAKIQIIIDKIGNLFSRRTWKWIFGIIILIIICYIIYIFNT